LDRIIAGIGGGLTSRTIFIGGALGKLGGACGRIEGGALGFAGGALGFAAGAFGLFQGILGGGALGSVGGFFTVVGKPSDEPEEVTDTLKPFLV
jgi:hypothetical protein